MSERTPTRVLILGGTAEALALAKACAQHLPQLHVLTSLAGRTLTPATAHGETHVGGFGGVQGLADFLQQRAIDCVIDATHPFATQISQHAALACATLDLPRVQLLRAPWQQHADDHWIDASDMADAARQLAQRFTADSTRVFLSTGRQQLHAFSQVQHAWYLIRTVDALPLPPPLARYAAIVGRGPFAIADERALLREHKINIVISKNSGGEATSAKIFAARELALPVIMVQRPMPPEGLVVHGVDDVMHWLRSWH